jgi:hypothetical protein
LSGPANRTAVPLPPAIVPVLTTVVPAPARTPTPGEVIVPLFTTALPEARTPTRLALTVPVFSTVLLEAKIPAPCWPAISPWFTSVPRATPSASSRP